MPDDSELSKLLSEAYGLAVDIYNNIQKALSGSGIFEDAIKDLAKIKPDNTISVHCCVHKKGEECETYITERRYYNKVYGLY